MYAPTKSIPITGEKYNKPPVINFEAIFETSSPNVPIVFILSPGTEPANDLIKLADKVGMGTSKLKMLAMGQGQEKVSAKLTPPKPETPPRAPLREYARFLSSFSRSFFSTS